MKITPTPMSQDVPELVSDRNLKTVLLQILSVNVIYSLV